MTLKQCDQVIANIIVIGMICDVLRLLKGPVFIGGGSGVIITW